MRLSIFLVIEKLYFLIFNKQNEERNFHLKLLLPTLHCYWNPRDTAKKKREKKKKECTHSSIFSIKKEKRKRPNSLWKKISVI